MALPDSTKLVQIKFLGDCHMKLIEAKSEETVLLLGNEAITRGAIEAGIDIATTYPGTPSSEIADTFSAIAKYKNKKNKKQSYYFEYSVRCHIRS